MEYNKFEMLDYDNYEDFLKDAAYIHKKNKIKVTLDEFIQDSLINGILLITHPDEQIRNKIDRIKIKKNFSDLGEHIKAYSKSDNFKNCLLTDVPSLRRIIDKIIDQSKSPGSYSVIIDD